LISHDDSGSAQRQAHLIKLFQDARKSFPRWHHTALMDRVWRKRPHGTTFGEVRRVAELFRLPEG
jgi:hypothetical protein